MRVSRQHLAAFIALFAMLLTAVGVTAVPVATHACPAMSAASQDSGHHAAPVPGCPGHAPADHQTAPCALHPCMASTLSALPAPAFVPMRGIAWSAIDHATAADIPSACAPPATDPPVPRTT